MFSLAGAVVTDVGGVLSHAAIVAREFGLPAVVGTDVGTKVIQTGQTITVDGNAGVVYLDGREV
jgi:pyruvate,water dikinase